MENFLTAKDLVIHGGRLTGQLHQYIGKKTAPFEHIGAQIILQSILDGFFYPLQGGLDLSDVLEDDVLPDPGRLLINGRPDVFLAPKMAVEPPLVRWVASRMSLMEVLKYPFTEKN